MSSSHTAAFPSSWNHSVLQQCLSVLLLGTFFWGNSVVADEGAQQTARENEQAVDPREAEMEALGQSLKAAVISGQMDKADARALWEAALTEIKGDEDEGDDDESLEDSGGGWAARGRAAAGLQFFLS